MKPTTTTPLPSIPFPEAGSLIIKNYVASASFKSDGTASTDDNASTSLERLIASSGVNTKLRRHQPKKGSTGKKGKIFAQKVNNFIVLE